MRVDKKMIGLGVALLLALPTAPAWAAAGGQSAKHAHHATVAPRHDRDKGTHGKRLRQFEGKVVSFDGSNLVVKLQGSSGVTVTVGISATGTRITMDGVVTTTAALASGEQVHVAASASTVGGVTTFMAVRVDIQRPDVDSKGTADVDAPGTGKHTK